MVTIFRSHLSHYDRYINHYSNSPLHCTTETNITQNSTCTRYNTLIILYTKILQTTSNVLFLYSTITDYPSNISSVVWSIDANVPLFGLHHSVLFAFNILIFLLLILYTVMLLFGSLSNFRFAVYINPLLNAYSKVYKNNCCYCLLDWL